MAPKTVPRSIIRKPIRKNPFNYQYDRFPYPVKILLKDHNPYVRHMHNGSLRIVSFGCFLDIKLNKRSVVHS